MIIPFTKMSGAGNDFVVVDNRAGIIKDAESFSIKVCNRRFGVGADGVLLLENSESSAFTMKYYNADGSNAGMCGNGGRCLAKFAYDLSITGGNDFIFDAFGYQYQVHRYDDTTYELKMKDPFDVMVDQQISLMNRVIRSNYVNTGTDHAVIFLEENPDLEPLQSANVYGIGKSIRYHEVYQPLGTNVNFVTRGESNSIEIRTYERGVEDETLACGTGSVASAILSSERYGMVSPIHVKVKSGEILTVSFDYNGGKFTNVRLRGSAQVTFTGEYDWFKI